MQVDANGRLVGVAYHDGALEGVTTDAGGVIRLTIRSSGGEQWFLLLEGVVAFRVDAFREGNIIHSIRWLTKEQVQAASSVSTLLSERLYLHPEGLPPDIHVFLLEPSFGAEVVSVCRGFTIQP